jgi:hypothetical protein
MPLRMIYTESDFSSLSVVDERFGDFAPKESENW